MVKRGFTLIELLLVIGIFAILATLTSISYFSTYSHSNLSAAKDLVIADLKSAQANAMSGLGDTTWDASMTTSLPTTVSLSTTFEANQFTFQHGTGEILNFVLGQDSLVLTSGNDTSTIRLNKYGTIIGD